MSLDSRSSPYAVPRQVDDPGSCDFYHVMEIPGYGTTSHCQWDLRGRERSYVGNVDLAGKRVLEIGPASGFLTFFMEAQGADVVAVELPPDGQWDIVPEAGVDLEEFRRIRREGLERTRNAFWFAHQRFASKARVHYGNVYALPELLGHFDVAVMCSVLLHVRDPLHVVEQCAALADTLVVTDMHYGDISDSSPIQQWFSTAADASPDIWWRFSPQLFVRFGEVMGYGSSVSFHKALYVADGGQREADLFTVVLSKHDRVAS